MTTTQRVFSCLPLDQGIVGIDDHLINCGYLSSLDYMNFIISVENEFHLKFSNEDIAFACLFTVRSIVEKIDSFES